MSDLNDNEVRRIVAYCSEEVRRQGRGPLQVANMVDAWLSALHPAGQLPTYFAIENWGRLIEPNANQHGYRKVNVQVGDHIAPDAAEVSRLMTQYVEHFPDMEADDAYLEFERIHPFRDGNGRVGKILYNLKSGCLNDPIWPPNFWGIANP